MTAAEVEAPLLDLLCQTLDKPGLEYAERPHLLGDGVTARSFSFRLRGGTGATARPLVCRIFHVSDESLAPDQTHVEEALQNTLHDLGYPAPHVLTSGDATSALGVPFMVMEQVPGRNLFPLIIGAAVVSLAAALFGIFWPLAVVFGGYWALMAWLLTSLHALPGDVVRKGLAEQGLGADRLTVEEFLGRLRGRISRGRLGSLLPAIDWLDAHRPPEDGPLVANHGDFWFGNVMLAPGRASLLDWTQACVGHPEIDLGWMSLQHFSRAPVDVPFSEETYDRVMTLLRPFVWLVFGANRAIYRLFRPVDGGRLDYYMAMNCVRVLVSVAEAEKEAGEDGTSAMLMAWGSEKSQQLVRERLHRITGIEV